MDFNNPNHYNAYTNGTTIAPTYTTQQTYEYTYNQDIIIPETTYDLTIPKEQPADQRTDDELWVETFLSLTGKIHINLDSTIETNTKKTPKSNNRHPLSIHTSKTNLRSCLQIIGKLKALHKDLEDNISSMTTVEWKKRTIEIGELKDEFSSLMCQFRNKEMMGTLKKAVKARCRKRRAQRQRKIERCLQVEEEERKRKKIHEDVDRWLMSMKESVERVKMEENMRKDADCVLSEVTKKKFEARKQLSLIAALIKLRHVREVQALQRGEKISLEDSQAFNHVAERLTKIWENALKVYAKEEQGLRMMLEQNVAEDTNAARLEKERKITQEWDRMLFGPKVVPSPAYWGLTSADKNFETFVAIRKSWDTFLVEDDNPNGSRIPVGWVLPGINARTEWKTFLDTF